MHYVYWFHGTNKSTNNRDADQKTTTNIEQHFVDLGPANIVFAALVTNKSTTNRDDGPNVFWDVCTYNSGLMGPVVDSESH